VEHEKQVAFSDPDDPLSDTTETHDVAPDGGIEWRMDGSKQERGCKPDALENTPDNPGSERREIELDVRQFGHIRS
jgi:hypothetical protein